MQVLLLLFTFIIIIITLYLLKKSKEMYTTSNVLDENMVKLINRILEYMNAVFANMKNSKKASEGTLNYMQNSYRPANYIHNNIRIKKINKLKSTINDLSIQMSELNIKINGCNDFLKNTKNGKLNLKNKESNTTMLTLLKSEVKTNKDTINNLIAQYYNATYRVQRPNNKREKEIQEYEATNITLEKIISILNNAIS